MKLSDDHGMELEVEHLGDVEYNNKTYTLLFPLDNNEAQLALIVEKIGEDQYIPVLDEKILETVYSIYEQQKND